MHFWWSILIACAVAWPAIHCYSFFMYFLFYFNIYFSFFPVMPYYSYTQTFSLIFLYCWYIYCVSFCALLEGVCLSSNTSIRPTYSRIYLLTVRHRTYAHFTLCHFTTVISHSRVQSTRRRASIRSLQQHVTKILYYWTVCVCVCVCACVPQW